MSDLMPDLIVNEDARILVTGAGGFIGTKVVERLVARGFKNLRCFVRSSSRTEHLTRLFEEQGCKDAELFTGDILSREDCQKSMEEVAVVYHLAAGGGGGFSGAFMNSVLSTRNLLDCAVGREDFKRFVNVSSFAVYSNSRLGRGAVLSESCELETEHVKRQDPYSFGKVKQDEILMEYGEKHGVPYVIVRPGWVYGPLSRHLIPPRVGLSTFGFFMHLGGSGQVPMTYVDNCGDAIVLAGIRAGVNGEVFNVVDDDIYRSRRFLRLYKKNVRWFPHLYLPYSVFYLFSWFWEAYADWSRGQLPPAFNRLKCSNYYKRLRYSNEKLKTKLGWSPLVPTGEGVKRYFEFVKSVGGGS